MKTPEQKSALKQEINLSRSLQHSSLPSLSEVQETKNSVYLLYESIKGKSIISKEHKPKKIAEIRKTFKKIFQVLQYLKQQNILILGLSPNILKFKYSSELVRISTPLITDFSTMVDLNFSEKNKKSIFEKILELKKNGEKIFTAPEILSAMKEEDLDNILSSKTEVYSLGILMAIILADYIQESIYFENEKNSKSIDLEFKGLNLEKLKNFEIEDESEEEEFKLLVNLVLMMTDFEPERRIDIDECLNHDFFGEEVKKVEQVGGEDKEENFFDYLFNLDSQEMEMRGRFGLE